MFLFYELLKLENIHGRGINSVCKLWSSYFYVTLSDFLFLYRIFAPNVVRGVKKMKQNSEWTSGCSLLSDVVQVFADGMLCCVVRLRPLSCSSLLTTLCSLPPPPQLHSIFSLFFLPPLPPSFSSSPLSMTSSINHSLTLSSFFFYHLLFPPELSATTSLFSSIDRLAESFC